MWTYVIEIDGFKFRCISEWAGNITVGIEDDYDVSSVAFMSAFQKIMIEKKVITQAMDFEVEAQQGSLHFARQFHGQTKEEWVEFLASIRDNPYLNPRTKKLVEKEISDLYEKEKARESSKVVRREMQREYDKLFMLIGRRDGFCCAECGKSTDLTIDHKIAVIKGGTNDVDNLRLLCKSHNSSKGAK
jgi:hypothetical protein